MTSLLSALRNPAMIPGNTPGSESDLRAQIETLRIQAADASDQAEVAERKLAFCKQELAVAREALESSRRALMLKQSEVDALTARLKLVEISSLPRALQP